jgi:hypothetical protein
MSQNIIEGIINYARNEIEERIKKESEKIVAEVVMETMRRVSIRQVNAADRLTTELIFKFEK